MRWVTCSVVATDAIILHCTCENSNVTWVRGCKPLSTYMKNSGTLFKHPFIFLMQDINKLLPKQYPEHFHNKMFLCCTGIWSKSSNSSAAISVSLLVTLCLWLLKYEVPNGLADAGKKVSYMLSNIPVALELATKRIPKLRTCAFLQSPCTAAWSKSTIWLFTSVICTKSLNWAELFIYLTSITQYILQLCALEGRKERWENYCKSLALKK